MPSHWYRTVCPPRIACPSSSKASSYHHQARTPLSNINWRDPVERYFKNILTLLLSKKILIYECNCIYIHCTIIVICKNILLNKYLTSEKWRFSVGWFACVKNFHREEVDKRESRKKQQRRPTQRMREEAREQERRDHMIGKGAFGICRCIGLLIFLSVF